MYPVLGRHHWLVAGVVWRTMGATPTITATVVCVALGAPARHCNYSIWFVVARDSLLANGQLRSIVAQWCYRRVYRWSVFLFVVAWPRNHIVTAVIPGSYHIISVLLYPRLLRHPLKNGVCMPRHIAITGASGLIGSALSHALIARGDHVVAFTRNPQHQGILPAAAQRVLWNPRDSHATATALATCDTIVNLVGASIAGTRWTPAYKQTLVTSRVNATQQLLAAVAQMPHKPTTFISSSGAGYYGINAIATTEAAPAGTDFLAKLCVDWESAAAPADTLGMRSVILRTGVVLDSTSGALPLMALPFRFFVGGPVLPGTQMISWIHITDMVQLLLWAIDNEHATGVYNACAPQPVSNHTLSSAIAQRLHRPSWLPVPQFALRLLFGEMADALLIGGQSVSSARLAAAGFSFRHPTIDTALANLW
jgi:uncharacterized protein